MATINIHVCFNFSRTQHTTDVRDKDNKTPLHGACLGANEDLVQYLVEEIRCDVGELKFFISCSCM